MREDHKNVFFQAADACICWIGLREPNPLADRWIGAPGYVPKGAGCKAKTSDNPAFRLAGLVVDPTVRPEAFTRESLGTALQTWNEKFLVAGRLPPGYTVVPRGPELGVVRTAGSAIFADYDLMAIARSKPDGEMQFTTEREQEALFATVEPILRRGLGVPMIQHGTEFMWRGGVGAREFEWVLWFGPGRRFKRSPSSMPHGGH